LHDLGSHHTDEFLQTCVGQGVGVSFLVPHSSDQPQPLEVLTFALMKRHFSGSRFIRLDAPTVKLGGPNPRSVERVRRRTSQPRSLPDDWARPIRGSLEVWGVLFEGATRGGPTCPAMSRTGGERQQGTVTAGGAERGTSPYW
jgi:hypothetical protein